MAKLNRKRGLQVAMESTYGVDPGAGYQFMLLGDDANIQPISVESVQRNRIRPFFGAQGQLPVKEGAQVQFTLELAGSGTAGTPPPFGPILRACGMSETIQATAVTGTSQGVGALPNSIRLAAGASATDAAYEGATIRITSGTGAGQSREIYFYQGGATKTAFCSRNWGTVPDNTSVYSIDPFVRYRPVTDAPESVSCIYSIDDVFYRMVGLRGSLSLSLAISEIPLITVNAQAKVGLYGDGTQPAASFAAWRDPVTVSTANTSDLIVGNFGQAVLERFDVDLGQQITHHIAIGSDEVLLVGRESRGSMTMQLESIALYDPIPFVRASSAQRVSWKHGQTAGNIVAFVAPQMAIANPQFGERDGITNLQFETAFRPFIAGGNDEISIIFK